MNSRKSVKVNKSVYNLINAVRKDNETFGDAIERIVKSGATIFG